MKEETIDAVAKVQRKSREHLRVEPHLINMDSAGSMVSAPAGGVPRRIRNPTEPTDSAYCTYTLLDGFLILDFPRQPEQPSVSTLVLDGKQMYRSNFDRLTTFEQLSLNPQ